MIESIVKHCNNLKDFRIEFTFNVRIKTLEKCFTTFSKQLKSFVFKLCDQRKSLQNCFFKNMKLCANITQLNDPYYTNNQNDCLSHILSDNRNDILFANLRSFEFRYSNGNHNKFEIFAQNYKNKLKSIKVFTDYSYDTNSFAIECNICRKCWH